MRLKKNRNKNKMISPLGKESVAKCTFTLFAAFSVLAVFAIIFYILYASIPAFKEIGFFKFVFGTEWSFDSADESGSKYGILPMILTSVFLTAGSVFLGGLLAVFTAVFVVFYCPKFLKGIFNQIINLFAGIPSIVYGYFGLTVLKPLMQKTFGVISAEGLLLSTLVLAIMIMPTVTSLAKNSLKNVPRHYYEGALALGANKHQAVFKICLPAAKKGIIAALILGVGRAIGETMAIQMLLGGSVNFPVAFFLPLRSLTTNIVQEFAYASGLHREALVATGFILLLFVLLINICLWAVNGSKSATGNKLFKRKIKENAEISLKLSYKKGGLLHKTLFVLSCITAAAVAVILFIIVGFVLVRGLPHLNADFLFGKSSNANVTLAPAFVSTALIILISLAIALPIGIGAAIFFNEYAKKGSKTVKVLRLFTDTLAGVPSIIFGLFGAIFFGGILKMGYSILAGSCTMALMILPTIVRSTEQSLSEVPDSMREASYALGAGKVRTIFSVVLPQSISGIITSVILSVGRIIGESAALIFTAGAFIRMPNGVMSPGSTFSVLMYNFMSEGLEVDKAYATGAVLIIFIFLLNIAVTVIGRLFKNRVSGKKSKKEKFTKSIFRRKKYEE